MRKKILVTGGLGYIGSHTTIQLLTNGYDVVCIDNLSNSKRLMLARIAEISGRSPSFVLGDVRDPAALSDVFARHNIESVIHFAGLKAVGESMREPLKYYDHNVAGTLNLLETMNAHNVGQIVFPLVSNGLWRSGVSPHFRDGGSRTDKSVRMDQAPC